MLSRRQFLQAAGIVVAAAHLPHLDLAASTASALPSTDALFGRALTTTPVYAAPNTEAAVSGRLWSDSITPILDSADAWYRLPAGYAPRTAMQPLVTPAQRSTAIQAPPFWAEVTDAVAIVRAHCAADAPMIARIGHGGALRVVDFLPDEGVNRYGVGWYGVAREEHGDLLGWTQTAAWSPVQIDHATPALTLQIDRAAQRLDVFRAGESLLSAPISTGDSLIAGSYAITRRQVSAASDPMGASWLLSYGDGQQISGVYWHNQFGSPFAGSAVQVTPALAKWLFPRVEKVIVY